MDFQQSISAFVWHQLKRCWFIVFCCCLIIGVASYSILKIPQLLSVLMSRLHDGNSNLKLESWALVFLWWGVSIVLLTASSRFMLMRLSRQIALQTRLHYLAKMLAHPFQFANHVQPATAIVSLQNDPEHYRYFFLQIFLAGAFLVLLLSIAMPVLVSGGIVIFLLSIISVGIALKLMFASRGRMIELTRVVRDDSNRLGAATMNLATEPQLMRILNARPGLANQYKIANANAARSQEKLWAFMDVSGLSVKTVNDLAQVLVLGVGGWIALNEQIDVATIIAIYGTIALFSQPIATLFNLSTYLRRAEAGRESILQIVDPLTTETQNDTTKQTPSHAVQHGESQSILTIGSEFEPAARLFPGGLKLKNNHLVVCSASGEEAINFANSLLRFNSHAQRGQVSLRDEDLCDWPILELRRRIGFLDQEHFFTLGTLRENLSMGLGRLATDEEINRYAYTACVEDLVGPSGSHQLDTVVDIYRAFSGGQQSRLGLLRFLIAEFEIGILNDPTSNLDSQTELRLLERLHRVQSMSVIIFTVRSAVLTYEAANSSVSKTKELQ